MMPTGCSEMVRMCVCKDGPQQNKKKEKMVPLTLAKQRKSQKMVLTTLHPWGVSQQAPAPQTSALKLTMSLFYIKHFSNGCFSTGLCR